MLVKRIAFWVIFILVWLALFYYAFFFLAFVFGIGRDSSDHDLDVFCIVVLILEGTILLAGLAYIFLKLRRWRRMRKC